jgi:hypothetical protein
MRITSAGDVGIGTGSPSEKLTVIGNQLIAPNTLSSAADTYIQTRLTGTGDGSPNSVRFGIDGTAFNGVAYINTLNAGVAAVTPLTFRISSTERMRITSAGDVGIGTSSPAYKLDVTGTIYASTNYFTANDANLAWGSGATRLSGNSTNNTMVFLTNNAERMRITSTGQLRTTVTGTTMMDEYGCRAWVNFNGTGTVSIRGSGNVSSITDNGTGDYTINFTTAMPDANYSAVGQAHSPGVSNHVFQAPAISAGNQTTTSIRCSTPLPNTGANADAAFVQAAIIR